MNGRLLLPVIGSFLVVVLPALACGDDDSNGSAAVEKTVGDGSPSTVGGESPSTAAATTELLPDETDGGAPCATFDDTNGDGPISVAIGSFTEAPGDPRRMSGRAVIENTSDKSIRIYGEGPDLLFGYVVDDDGSILSSPPPDVTVSEEMPVVEPGESLEWPVVLWLERCGIEEESSVPAGTYDVHVQVRLASEDGSGHRTLLSVESVEIQIDDL